MSSGDEPSMASRPDTEAASRRGASPVVVVARVLLILGAAAAMVSSVLLAHAHDLALHAAAARYVCPMHPSVFGSVPGDCPICGMALERVTDSRHGAAFAAETAGGVSRAERRVVAEQVRAGAWLGADGIGTAVLYRDDLVGLQSGDHALFFGGRAPNMGVDVHLLPGPPSPADASTVRIRFGLDGDASAPDPRGRPREIGSLQISVRARELLVVPSSAVLYSAQGPYVLAASNEGDEFAKRPVAIGRVLDSGYVGSRVVEAGAIVILSGLREGERVIAASTFFFDAERRLSEARGRGEGVKQ